MPVVMISGHGNIETAVAAIKRGAYDFIEKPFKADRLILVRRARSKRRVSSARSSELKQLAPAAGSLVGRSPCMNQLRQTIERAAKANSRIMIVGPSGSGKELAARTLHTHVEPRGGTVCRHQRRCNYAGTNGIRTVRCRADRRSAAAQGRGAGRGTRRHAVHRRDRRHAARDSEQDHARLGRPDLSARPAARPRSMLTCASFRRPRATWRRRSLRAVSARISTIGCRSCRSRVPPLVRTPGGYSRTDRIFHGPDLCRERAAEAQDW